MSHRQKVRGYWQTLTLPSRFFGRGFLTLGGFIAGIVFWGGFNTALELTKPAIKRHSRCGAQ